MTSPRHASLALLLLVSCGGQSALSRANAGLSTALAATNAARDALTSWDADAQAEIVARALSEAEGKAALAAYRGHRAAVVETFVVAYSSIALASSALALYDADRLNAAEVIMRLQAVGKAVREVVTTVDALRKAVIRPKGGPK